MFSKILVPMDGSEVAECVLPHVEKIATGSRPARVTFLYVVQPFDAPSPPMKLPSLNTCSRPM